MWCGSACCATSLNQTYPRISYTRSTALAASCPVASDSAGSPSKQVSAPETHPSPVAYSFSYIVVAYSASWSSYSSRASFHSSSLRPRRSSGSIQLTLVSMLIGFLLLHVGNKNRIIFYTLLYKWSTRFLIPRLDYIGLGKVGGRTFHQTVGQTRPKIRSPPFWL